MPERCHWAGNDPVMIEYHDTEWGAPLHDDRGLFEFLILEGAQAGLSWMTILRKREGYRIAFRDFDPAVVADFGPDEIEVLLLSPLIVRNRAKITAAVSNARAFLTVVAQHGSFDAYIWSFIGGKPRQNTWQTANEIPAETIESQAMSASLRNLGFKFIGPTICYAFMQAIGMVNDHMVSCFRHSEAPQGPHHLPLPPGWEQTSTGEPMPDWVSLLHRSRSSH